MFIEGKSPVGCDESPAFCANARNVFGNSSPWDISKKTEGWSFRFELYLLIENERGVSLPAAFPDCTARI